MNGILLYYPSSESSSAASPIVPLVANINMGPNVAYLLMKYDPEIFHISENSRHVYNSVRKGIKCLICGFENSNFGIK